jgi:hypothetical protein
MPMLYPLSLCEIGQLSWGALNPFTHKNLVGYGCVDETFWQDERDTTIAFCPAFVSAFAPAKRSAARWRANPLN